MNVLRLTYVPDDEAHGELQAEVEAFGFAGRGSAWFERQHLSDFASSLEAHPIDRPVMLADHVIGPDGTPQVFEFRLGIGPMTGTGTLLVEAELTAEPFATTGCIRQRCRVKFPVEYAGLDRFRVAFVRMLDGGGRAELHGSDP